MVAYGANRRTILALSAVLVLVIIFLHVTQFRAYFDETRESEWFRSFRYHTEADTGLWVDIGENAHGDVREKIADDDRPLSLDAIHDIVRRTNGYLVRDWSMWLGWNNVRYIVEAGVLQAELLNRTLVLPSYIYARGCEFHIDSCAAYFNMVNRNDAMESDEWRYVSHDEQMGWQIPMSMMIDLPRLRDRHPTILVSEYLRIHGLPEDIERPKGNWDREKYHEGSYVFSSRYANQNHAEGNRPSLYVIHNDWYQDNIARVDFLTTSMKSRGEYDLSLTDPEHDRVGAFRNTKEDSSVYQRLIAELGEERKVEWDKAKDILRDEGIECDTDEEVGDALRENGWEVLYTYAPHGGMEFMKTVTDPVYQTAPRSRLRGFKDDFAYIKEDVLMIEGETHLGSKPGQVEFSTSAARNAFTDIVTHYIVPPPKVYRLANLLAKRMSERVDGRMWMAAHMRRGDFARIGWVMESSVEEHIQRIKNRLEDGRQKLIELHRYQVRAETYDVPGVIPDNRISSLTPPTQDAPFYLATDERNPTNLDYMASEHAVFVSSLLTTHDRREFGPEIMITDVLALVEQVIMSKADYFYGHVMSSVTGGVVNMRAKEGKDPRSALTD